MTGDTLNGLTLQRNSERHIGSKGSSAWSQVLTHLFHSHHHIIIGIDSFTNVSNKSYEQTNGYEFQWNDILKQLFNFSFLSWNVYRFVTCNAAGGEIIYGKNDMGFFFIYMQRVDSKKNEIRLLQRRAAGEPERQTGERGIIQACKFRCTILYYDTSSCDVQSIYVIQIPIISHGVTLHDGMQKSVFDCLWIEDIY